MNKRLIANELIKLAKSITADNGVEQEILKLFTDTKKEFEKFSSRSKIEEKYVDFYEFLDKKFDVIMYGASLISTFKKIQDAIQKSGKNDNAKYIFEKIKEMFKHIDNIKQLRISEIESLKSTFDQFEGKIDKELEHIGYNIIGVGANLNNKK